jgi:hypothetical protein
LGFGAQAEVFSAVDRLDEGLADISDGGGSFGVHVAFGQGSDGMGERGAEVVEVNGSASQGAGNFANSGFLGTGGVVAASMEIAIVGMILAFGHVAAAAIIKNYFTQLGRAWHGSVGRHKAPIEKIGFRVVRKVKPRRSEAQFSMREV